MNFITDKIYKISGFIINSENMLQPCQFNMKIRITFAEHTIGDYAMVSKRGVTRAEEYIKNVLNNAVYFSGLNINHRNMLFDNKKQPTLSNFIVEIPTNSILVSDIGYVLYTKLNALLDGAITYMEFEGVAGDDNTISCFIAPHDDIELFEYNRVIDLPTMATWRPDNNAHSLPWWERNDGSTLDLIVGNKKVMSRAYCGYDFDVKNKTIGVFEPKIQVN